MILPKRFDIFYFFRQYNIGEKPAVMLYSYVVAMQVRLPKCVMFGELV